MQLLIDTSTRYASVGISREGALLLEMTWRSERNHSVELVPAVREVMHRTGVEAAQLSAIFSAIGPGGFSALRVGMSTAKTLAVALDVPLVAVGTLDVEAEPYLGIGGSVVAVIGAGRNRLYIGRYHGGPDAVEPTFDVMSVDEFVESLEPGVLVCGEEAVPVARSLEEKRIAGVQVIMRPAPTRAMSVMSMLGDQKLRAGQVADPASLEPMYLRSSQINVANRRWATA